MKNLLFICALVCMATACSKKESSETSQASSTADMMRTTFIEACTVPMKGQLGDKKATKMCSCIFDSAADKWGAENLATQMANPGKEFQKIAMKCMTK